MKCDYCRELNKDELIFETKFWKVVIAPDQAYLGRCYVILKRHCGDLAELENSEWSDFIEIVKKVESALKKSFNATMFNWTCLMNNAYRNDPPNPHVHWHLRPRYNHKVEFAGEVFEDPEFGHHYSRERKQEISDVVKKKIVDRIKENL
jgi:diadenosine tetraphosphate (Ap4A) HIT family hydrolase